MLKIYIHLYVLFTLLLMIKIVGNYIIIKNTIIIIAACTTCLSDTSPLVLEAVLMNFKWHGALALDPLREPQSWSMWPQIATFTRGRTVLGPPLHLRPLEFSSQEQLYFIADLIPKLRTYDY